MRRAEKIEQLVVETVIGRLSRPDAYEMFQRPSGVAEARVLRNDIRTARARLDGLAEAFAAGEIDASQLGAGSRRLRESLARHEASLAALSRSPVLGSLAGSHDVRGGWNVLDLESARAIVSELMGVTIDPAGRGRRTFDPATVRIEWMHSI